MAAVRTPLWLAVLMVASAAAAPAATRSVDVQQARRQFLASPDQASAAAAWTELLGKGKPDDLLAAYNAASELYPLDDVDADRCAAQVTAIRAALLRNPLTPPALLALALCAEHSGDAKAALHWRTALEAWLAHALADGRGQTEGRPVLIVSSADLDTLDLATGVNLTGRYWLWQHGDDSRALLQRAGWTDARGVEHELFFDVSSVHRSIRERGVTQPADALQVRRRFHQQLLAELAEFDPLAEGFVASLKWNTDAQSRSKLRQLAVGGNSALGFVVLQRCLAGSAESACTEADLDPLLDSADPRDSLLLRGLLLQQTLAPTPARTDAVATVFAALRKRVGTPAAVAQVWADLRRIGRLDRLPPPVLEQTRFLADAGDPSSLYALARYPRDAQDRERAARRLQQSVDLGHAPAKVRRAGQLQATQPAAARALYEQAAAQGHHGAQLALLQLQYPQAAAAQRQALVEQALASIGRHDGKAMLWLARHYSEHPPADPAASFDWAALAVQSRSRRTAQAALQWLLEHHADRKAALAQLPIASLLKRLQPDPLLLHRWCWQRGLAQACLRRFDLDLAAAGSDQAVSAQQRKQLLRAAELGDRTALRRWGFALVSGQYGVRNGKRGLDLLDQATGMGDTVAQNNAAWVRCVSLQDTLYQPALGLSLITHLLTLEQAPAYSDTLAACQAANGDFKAAAITQQDVIERVQAALGHELDSADGMRTRLQLYAAGRAYRSDE